jgi:hypothetical protein
MQPTCVLQVHDGEEFNTVAAGEEIAVQVTFKNPLAIKLSLSHVRLQVQFTPAGSAGAAGAATTAAAAADGSAAAAATPRQDEVVVVESQFSLHPGGWRPLVLGDVLGVCLLIAYRCATAACFGCVLGACWLGGCLLGGCLLFASRWLIACCDCVLGGCSLIAPSWVNAACFG